ncbi:putative nuclease HARBI1 [Xenopus laevis]|uniref:Putative nuclease HARBI1 n=1 Tax=Xenopus laevis TaxID=8355 RepID=A0A8J0V9F3_XENLA|nr:putative nuclease HARBI1 [Xenopus laevis]
MNAFQEDILDAAVGIFILRSRYRRQHRRNVRLPPIEPIIRPRIFRERLAMLDKLSDGKIVSMFRLKREAILELYAHISEDTEPLMGRSHAVPGMCKLLAVLYLVANGSFQHVIYQVIGISQSSMSRIIPQVFDAILKLTRNYIYFPSNNEAWQALKLGFYQLGGMPNVLGAIDCTHVMIVPPRANEEQFRNRKNTHSISVQVVCDYKMQILSVCSGFPGSCHDSFILQQSALREKFVSGNMPDGWLVGDAGYGCQPWMLTPLLNPENQPEMQYNLAHRKTRGVIERTFGVLKSRFRCLDKSGGWLLYDPNSSVATIHELELKKYINVV